MVTKTCTKCKNTFPATKEYFYKKKSRGRRTFIKDGKECFYFTSRCKLCVRKDVKIFDSRPGRKEKKALVNKQWREENKELLKQKRKIAHEANPEKRRERDRKYNAKPETKKRKSTYNVQYREKNISKIRKKAKQYYEENKEEILKKDRIYKQNRPAGIYSITCTENEKIYIGQSTSYHSRWSHHKSRAQRQCHENPEFQKDWNKYGIDCFVFELIEELPHDCTRESLIRKEAEQIKKMIREGREIYNKINW